MTRLPLALEPADDESWPSYLTRRAAQHGTTLAGMGSHLGLRDSRGRWPGRFGVTMDETNVGRVAPLLGLTPEQVDRMQLATYDQLAFDLGGLAHKSAIAGTRATTHTAWVWLAGSTFCPLCLAEDDGVWRLRWRVPWITTCLRHGVHLHGTCRVCGGVPSQGSGTASTPPRPHASRQHLTGGPALTQNRVGTSAAQTSAPSPPCPRVQIGCDAPESWAPLSTDAETGSQVPRDHPCRHSEAGSPRSASLSASVRSTRAAGAGHIAGPTRRETQTSLTASSKQSNHSSPRLILRWPPTSWTGGCATLASARRTPTPLTGSPSPQQRSSPSSTSCSVATAGRTP